VQQVHGRTHTVARSFDRICGLLTSLGSLEADGERVAEPGETLRRLYTERDLLTAECLRRGVWRRLDPAGLAAVVSALVHEPRRDELDAAPRAPTDDVAAALTEMDAVWAQLEQAERAHGVPSSDPPDPGIAWMIHRWARGRRLEEVLRGGDLAAGDFVRRCKQVADLLGQIADLAPHPAMAGKARAAVDAVLRGVVAADRLD
jgi:ATP-dependent RNA helicase HelY